MINLLLTGVNGFIGGNIIKYIDEQGLNKYRIILLSSSPVEGYITILHKGYTFTKQDFCKYKIEKIDVVLHMGAFAPKSALEANNIKKSNENIVNTKHILDNLPNIPTKFIFLSAIDIYGKTDIVVNEETTPNPLTMYGWSKLYNEKMLENWAVQHGVCLQILRIGHIYGCGEQAYKKLIPVTIQKLKKGERPQIIGDGNVKRSFLHVNDVCRFIMKAILLDKYYGVINLCSFRAYKIKEIIDILIESSQKNIDIDFIQSKDKEFNSIYDVSKMNRLLGFEKINIRDGLLHEYLE